MAWLQLTTEDNRPILLDSEKILFVKPHTLGAHVTLTIGAPNKDGNLALKTATVQEDVMYIGKLLRASVSKIK
ncbi:hypothetical protein [Sinorhizobium sp. RAC02]|uniref:hypothetical protein n=1 Tax=Sinorhizobium sp. RAC02 TaxID=1842534 RepID=UPI00083DFDF7|nr:hypothetical protein [Sinorhizobium sp. RAC02]AOF94433.1 hypothetical protein BSY16_5125 [Sinorhizobium sp. RAC02]